MYYFVVNPVSGCGKGKKIWNTIKKELDQLSVEYEALYLCDGRIDCGRCADGAFAGCVSCLLLPEEAVSDLQDDSESNGRCTVSRLWIFRTCRDRPADE